MSRGTCRILLCHGGGGSAVGYMNRVAGHPGLIFAVCPPMRYALPACPWISTLLFLVCVASCRIGSRH